MSTNVAGSNNPIDSEEQLSQLIQIDADSIEEAGLEDIRIADIPLGKLLSKALENSKEAKQTSEDLKATTDSHEQAIKHLNTTTDANASDTPPQSDTEEPTLYRRETPLERLLDEPSNSAVRITKSVGRALTIAGNFKQWGKRIQGKYIINEGLKNLLSATEHERLAWKQVHRAAHKLEELTNGNIEFKKTQHQGRILVIEDLDWFFSIIRRQRGEGVR
jgi:hypothetical protein